jgi:hypothetical protein
MAGRILLYICMHGSTKFSVLFHDKIKINYMYRSRRQTLTAFGEEQERERALKYGGL